MPELERAECEPTWSMAANHASTTRHCSGGEECVSHLALGVPAKLSRGNPGPRCFACEEHHAAAALSKATAKTKTAGGRENYRRPPTVSDDRRGLKQSGPTCALGYCERPAVELLFGVRLCKEHAKATRARERQVECSMVAHSCEANLRQALTAGDEALARKWSGMLEEARGRLALAEATLAAAEVLAHSEPRFAV